VGAISKTVVGMDANNSKKPVKTLL